MAHRPSLWLILLGCFGTSQSWAGEAVPAVDTSSTTAPPALASPPTEAPSDHATVVGRMGVSWFGISSIVIGRDGVDANQNPVAAGSVSAPCIGARYWVSDRFGLEAGVGVALVFDSDRTSVWALLAHVGVPISLHSAGHFAFVVVPEVNFGRARKTDGLERTGVRLDVGARAGAELHFGFIGVPDLSLDAGVAAYFSYTSRSGGEIGTTDELSQFELATTSLNSPWDFLRTTIAARYYF